MKASSQATHKPLDGSVQRAGMKKRKAVLSRGRSAPIVMTGRAASAGMAVGLVAVVANLDDMAHVKEGMVIVSKTASPALAMVMSRTCGLATEYGGQGAIASGFARAHGIPAVVGIEGLLKTVRDGDLMRVNGTEGTVSIVKRSVTRLTRPGPSGTGAGRDKEVCGRPNVSCLAKTIQPLAEDSMPPAGNR